MPLFEGAPFQAFLIIGNHPTQTPKLALEISQRCLCSTDRFPGEPCGSKPSGPWTVSASLEKEKVLFDSDMNPSSTPIYSFYRNFPSLLYPAPIYWFPVKPYSSHEDLGTQRKRNLADAAAPNSSHRIPEAPLPSATQHPPAADTLANGGGG